MLPNVRQSVRLPSVILVFNPHKGTFGAHFPRLPSTDSHPHLPLTESHRHNLGTNSVGRTHWDFAPDSAANL